jgi:hypothetical protein
MVPIMVLAPAAPSTNVQPKVSRNQSVTRESNATVMKGNVTAPTAMIVGMNQKLERMRSQYLKIFTFTTSSPHSLACPLRSNYEIGCEIAVYHSLEFC